MGIGDIQSVAIGGLNEGDVPSVLGDRTKSKTDLTITLMDGKRINVSIKKSYGGQVYLIGVERFIEGYEKQYGEYIPLDIKELLLIYFYGSHKIDQLLEDKEVVNGESLKLIEYQHKHNRLVWQSLLNWDSDKAELLLSWFKNNISNIVDFCFSKGLAKEEQDWAHYVWYINLLGEEDIDTIIAIDDICNMAVMNKHLVTPGKRNGGSTILLPFGFVQWHLKQMQFHHSLNQIEELLGEHQLL